MISLTVNGKPHSIAAHPMERLLDVLREELNLTGTKEGCGEGECGACSVLIDDELVNSCLVPVGQLNGARICTVEGLAQGDQLHRMQQAFAQAGAAQCGICTPGMLMASIFLLNKTPNPSLEQIKTGLAGNLCRCTGYQRIIEAVQLAAYQDHP
jgi:carbon-monoxide dehydrogenase small subunit